MINEGQVKPTLFLNTDEIPLNHSLNLAITLFMIELDKAYKLKIEVFDGHGNVVKVSATQEFSSNSLDLSGIKVYEEKYFASSFSITTPTISFSSKGEYYLAVTLLSGDEELDTARTYFYIDN